MVLLREIRDAPATLLGRERAPMIPTLIVPGLLLGRWWFLAVAVVAWPAILVAGDVGSGARFVLGAAALALANAVVGVIGHHAVRAAVRTARSRGRSWESRS